MKNLCSGLFLLFALLFTACSPEELPVPADLSPVTEQAIDKRVTAIATPEKGETTTAKTVELQLIRTDFSVASQEFWVDFAGDYDFSEVECNEVQQLRFVSPTGKDVNLDFPVLEATGGEGYLQLHFLPTLSQDGVSKNEGEPDSTQSIIINDEIVI